ncbi:MAG: hypothetical protein EBZ69_03380 [Alphaproteobacteria bacterium]|nr:hypothetical protein [Alphaproteobacteria bacterium]
MALSDRALKPLATTVPARLSQPSREGADHARATHHDRHHPAADAHLTTILDRVLVATTPGEAHEIMRLIAGLGTRSPLTC